MILQILELPGHPYYVGVQFHPEFKSRPGKPSAVFLGELQIHFWVLYNCAIDWILFQMEWCFLVKKLLCIFPIHARVLQPYAEWMLWVCRSHSSSFWSDGFIYKWGSWIINQKSNSPNSGASWLRQLTRYWFIRTVRKTIVSNTQGERWSYDSLKLKMAPKALNFCTKRVVCWLCWSPWLL